MSGTISYETLKRMEKKEKSVEEIDKELQKYGFSYLAVYPDVLGQKPALFKGLEPETAQFIAQVGIRDMRKVLKRLKEAKK